MKDFDLALKDLETAQNLLPNEKDPAKLIAQYKLDKDQEIRI